MTVTRASAPIVIAGGSGFLGTSLAQYLAHRGASVVVLSRNTPKAAGKWRHVPWDARKAAGVRIGLPAFAWMVRIAAPLMRTDPELAVCGRYLVSRRLRDMQFEFQFPELPAALADLLGPRTP